jgi:catalase (peroxidase I)
MAMQLTTIRIDNPDATNFILAQWAQGCWEAEELYWGAEGIWLGDERYSGERQLAARA